MVQVSIPWWMVRIDTPQAPMRQSKVVRLLYPFHQYRESELGSIADITEAPQCLLSQQSHSQVGF